jgi:outer membrane lipoprotein-sorting protein
MLEALLLLAALGADAVDPISVAMDRYRAVDSYQVTLKSSAAGESEIVRYTYKKPGFVRMDFERPYQGAVLIYDPLKKQVRLWPFGLKLFALTLSPENRLVQSRTGQRVDKSDLGSLWQNVETLKGNGETRVLGHEIVSAAQVLHITVTGKENFVVDNVHRFDIWLEEKTGFPAKVVSRGADGDLIETVLFEDLKVNPELARDVFNP